MAKSRSKSIISIGFLTIMTIIVIFLIVWMDSLSKNKQYLIDVKKTQDKIYRIINIAEKVNATTNGLHQLAEQKKVLSTEALVSGINETTQSIKVLSIDLDHNGSRSKTELWQNMLQEYTAVSQQIIQYSDRKDNQAKQVIIDQLNRLHHQLVDHLKRALTAHKESAGKGLISAISRNDSVYYLIIMLAVAATLLGFLNVFVLRQSEKTEAALLENSTRIRKLYEITSKPGLSIEEQIRGMLKLGCELLGMQIGKVCQIDIEKNTNSFLNVYAPKGFDVCAGTVMPLDKTFCSITARSGESLALHNVAKSIYGEKFSHLAAYTATTISVNGKPYGSVNFSSNTPKKEGFSEADKDLLRLIGAWVSSTLERRFAQEDLLIAKNEAEAASRTKSSFLANMSHELRTPLNAIIGYSELIQEEANYNGHDMYDKDLHTVNSSALHLLALIDDILDLSKIEAGKMEFYMEEFSVNDLVSEVSEIVAPLMKKKNNVFEVSVTEGIGMMLSDRLKMKQVLFNLLSNAGKFTEEGTVKLDVRLNVKKPNEVVFSVEDTGIGISDKQISKIFEAFAQADASTTSKFGGTGLGLAISRQICQLLHGDIDVKGEIGQGTTFVVTMPLGAVSQ